MGAGPVFENLRVTLAKGRRDKIRAFVSCSMSLADGEKIFLNSMRLSVGPKGLFLGFPGHENDAKNAKKKFEEHYFFGTATKKALGEAAVANYKAQVGE